MIAAASTAVPASTLVASPTLSDTASWALKPH